jgi:hypothetical protein
MDPDGRRGGAVKDIAKIVIAIILVVIAFKILKGILSVAVAIAAVGFLIWGGMKLLGNDTKRIR